MQNNTQRTIVTLKYTVTVSDYTMVPQVIMVIPISLCLIGIALISLIALSNIALISGCLTVHISFEPTVIYVHMVSYYIKHKLIR